LQVVVLVGVAVLSGIGGGVGIEAKEVLEGVGHAVVIGVDGGICVQGQGNSCGGGGEPRGDVASEQFHGTSKNLNGR
jgi:hypothetical protein